MPDFTQQKNSRYPRIKPAYCSFPHKNLWFCPSIGRYSSTGISGFPIQIYFLSSDKYQTSCFIKYACFGCRFPLFLVFFCRPFSYTQGYISLFVQLPTRSGNAQNIFFVVSRLHGAKRLATVCLVLQYFGVPTSAYRTRPFACSHLSSNLFRNLDKTIPTKNENLPCPTTLFLTGEPPGSPYLYRTIHHFFQSSPNFVLL